MQRNGHAGIPFPGHAVLQARQQPVVKLHQIRFRNQRRTRRGGKGLGRLNRSLQGAVIDAGDVIVCADIFAHRFGLPTAPLCQGKICPSLVHAQNIRLAFAMPDDQ